MRHIDLLNPKSRMIRNFPKPQEGLHNLVKGQPTAFGEAVMTTYIEVKKKDGTKRFYEVKNEELTEITEEFYLSKQNIKE